MYDLFVSIILQKCNEESPMKMTKKRSKYKRKKCSKKEARYSQNSTSRREKNEINGNNDSGKKCSKSSQLPKLQATLFGKLEIPLHN